MAMDIPCMGQETLSVHGSGNGVSETHTYHYERVHDRRTVVGGKIFRTRQQNTCVSPPDLSASAAHFPIFPSILPLPFP